MLHLHHLPIFCSHSFTLTAALIRTSSVVFVFDPSPSTRPILTIIKTPPITGPTLRTPLASKIAPLPSSSSATPTPARSTANAEENRGEQETYEGCPGEGVAVGSELCGLAVRFEGIAAED